LSYGTDILPVKDIREYWKAHYLSTVTGMSEVADIKRAIKYLAGYLSQKDKFIRAWCSQGWVFRGWLGVSRKYKREYEDYPLKSDLVRLALTTDNLRETEIEYLVNTGYLSEHYNKTSANNINLPNLLV